MRLSGKGGEAAHIIPSLPRTTGSMVDRYEVEHKNQVFDYAALLRTAVSEHQPLVRRDSS